MPTSKNPKIQKLMDEVEALDPNEAGLEAKLNLIAQKVAQEQRKMKAALTGTTINDQDLIDPSEAFACEGCQ